MKMLIVVFVVLFGAFSINAQDLKIKPKVDERIELMSIVFRLAEAEEYINNNLVDYVKDIDTYFGPFKNHKVVQYAKEVRESNQIGYDAVTSLAVQLSISESVKIQNNIVEGQLDKRWTSESASKFVDLLNQFYIKSNFHKFYSNHQELYRIAEANFAEISNEVDFSWFEKFFGEKSNRNFHIVLSMCNGRSNYGAEVQYNDASKELYAIIGSPITDKLNHPIYNLGDIFPLIIHEFNHSFCNPLIEPFYEEMETKADEFLKLNESKMLAQAYDNSKTMMYEILVRACVIHYFRKYDLTGNKIKHLIIKEQAKGFVWIDELVNSLSEYDKNRDKYPTLKDYMPQIVKLLNGLNPDKYQEAFDSKCAKIISTNIPNNATDVDPNIAQIVVKFDKPMFTQANGASFGKRGKEFLPESPEGNAPVWNLESKAEWIIPVMLQANKEYSISFPAQFFFTEDGYPLKETFFLDFKTKDK